MPYKALTPVYNLGNALGKYLGIGGNGSSDIPDTVRESVDGKSPRTDYKTFQTQLSTSSDKILSTKERLINSIPKIRNGDSYFAPDSLFERVQDSVRLS